MQVRRPACAMLFFPQHERGEGGDAQQYRDPGPGLWPLSSSTRRKMCALASLKPLVYRSHLQSPYCHFAHYWCTPLRPLKGILLQRLDESMTCFPVEVDKALDGWFVQMKGGDKTCNGNWDRVRGSRVHGDVFWKGPFGMNVQIRVVQPACISLWEPSLSNVLHLFNHVVVEAALHFFLVGWKGAPKSSDIGTIQIVWLSYSQQIRKPSLSHVDTSL